MALECDVKFTGLSSVRTIYFANSTITGADKTLTLNNINMRTDVYAPITVACDIVVENNAQFYLRGQNAKFTFNGDVSGSGALTFDADGNPNKAYTFNGSFNFTGTITLKGGANTDTNNNTDLRRRVPFNLNSTGENTINLVGATMDVGQFCDVNVTVAEGANSVYLPTGTTYVLGTDTAVRNSTVEETACLEFFYGVQVTPGETTEVEAETAEEAVEKVVPVAPQAVQEAGVDTATYLSRIKPVATLDTETGKYKITFDVADSYAEAEQTKVTAAATEALEEAKEATPTGTVFGKIVTIDEVKDLTPGFYYEFAAYDKDADKFVAWECKMADKDGKIDNALIPYTTGEGVQVFKVNSYLEEQK